MGLCLSRHSQDKNGDTHVQMDESSTQTSNRVIEAPCPKSLEKDAASQTSFKQTKDVSKYERLDSNELQQSNYIQQNQNEVDSDTKNNNRGGLYLADEQSGVPIHAIPAEEDYLSRAFINLNINLSTDLNPPLGRARLKGEGGFGKVYRSNYEGRPVAVKLFKMQYQQYWGGDAEDEFIKELNIICRLEHDHIVKCYGACMKPGEKAIVMEYVENSLHDLIHRVKRTGPMRLTSIYKIIKSIAKALEFLHQRIVHRDLHPLNVLIAKDGCIKVADFGISRLMDHSTTIVSDQKGAPAYVAPEVFANKLTIKADIYALGVIAWELWTLQQPWKESGYGLIVRNVTEGKRPEIPADIPKDLEALITKCWQQNYDKRPKAREIYLECNRILDNLNANPT